MKSQTRNASLWLGYDVISEMTSFARPHRIEFWKDQDFQGLSPETPFHYKSDALMGLSLYLLHSNWSTKHLPARRDQLTEDLWKSLEPHYELWLRAQPRIQALRAEGKANKNKTDHEDFILSFGEILAAAEEKSGFNLDAIHPLTELIDQIEVKTGRPMLYDFSLQLPQDVRTKLHWLHSMLFHLRTLVAMDYNAYIHDPTHEAIKVDSITDYVARAEYVANDALLYWNFKKMRARVPDDVALDLEQQFLTYSHNGAYLIESLPKSFLNGMNSEELEETLYLVQMDWLLGTDAGLLFRIREEIYGLQEGYENIFWPDLHNQAKPTAGMAERLSIQCELSEQSLERAS